MAEALGANDEIYNRLIDNQAMSRLFSEKVQIDVSRAVRRHKGRLLDITKENPKSPEVPKEINRFIKDVSGITRGHLTEYGSTQLTFHTGNLHKAVGNVYKVKPPRNSELLSNIVGTNIKGNTSLTDEFGKIGRNSLIRVEGIIKNGVAKGLTTEEISAKIVKSVDVTEAQALALTRTAITRITNNAQSEVMFANQGIMKGYQFTAILDSRTSDICKFNNGLIFPWEDKSHLPPLHWRCRSTIIPLTKSLNEMLETKDDRFRKAVLKELPDSARKKLDGRSIGEEGYGNWLKRQAYEVKLRHFGNDPAKVDVFDQGQVEVKDFKTSKGDWIGIDALRRLNNYATRIFTQRRASIIEGDLPVKALRPQHLLKDKKLTDDLRDFYITEASNQNSPLSVVDYKGTSLAGKNQSRRNANNIFDERSSFVDPMTGDVTNTYLYDPDFQVYQERIDFLKASKILKDPEKAYIEEFVASLDDTMSVNQQAVILENMRLNFERYYDFNKPSYRKDWDNFDAVIRGEMPNSVVNVSRILDRRSRSRAVQFTMFGDESSDASIQINGEWYSFDKLSDELQKDRQYKLNWKKNYGKALARKAYYSGRAPLRDYFTSPLEGIKTPQKYLEGFVKKAPGGDRFLKALKGEPMKSIPQEIWDNLTEDVRSLFNREMSLRQWGVDLRESFFRKQQTDGANLSIDSLAEAFEMVASGTTTDYDTLAINLGKMLTEKHPLKILAGKGNKGTHLLGAPTTQEYHQKGSKLLRMLESRGMIKVAPRGITRRAVNDLETGRASGAWNDTVSREVLLYDKDLRELNNTSRRIYVGERVGVTNWKNRVVVDPSTKTYKTLLGDSTGDTIITRRANAHYDKVQIDNDMANEINWANNTEWKVDQDYSNFMLDLVRFRDNRGQVDKYDDLNGVRQIVMQRGDMGLGMMQTVKWHRDNDTTFRVVHQIDSRGRIYGRGYLTPTGGEFVRPFLNTAKVEELGPEGFYQFMEQVGSLVGEGEATLTNRGRFELFNQHRAEMIALGRNMLSSTQKDRRIRDVLEHPLVQHLDPMEQPKLLRYALETTRMDDHLKGNWDNAPKRLSNFKTQLPIEIDASASGAQIIALSTKNRALAFESNVVPTPQKNRLYDTMAKDTINDPRYLALTRLPPNLTWEDLSKAAKAQNMVSFYGAGKTTQTANLADKFAKELLKRDMIVITRARTSNTPAGAYSQLEFNKIIDEKIKEATYHEATETVKELNLVKKELNDVIDNSAPVGSELRSWASDLHPDVEEFVNKVSSTSAKIVGPEEFKQLATIMSEHLARRAPVTEKFIAFWKGVAQTYILETQKVDIPWVTFDGKVLRQRYRPTVEEYINWIDPNTGRRVKNIYRDKVEDGKFLGKSSIIGARTGLGVNGNHSNDAAIVRQFHLWGRENKIPTATIHDAFFVNMGQAAKAKNALRTIYADAVDSDTIVNTLKQMRKDGMSEESYNAFIQQAIDDGLIPSKKNALTREEVIRPLQSGETWYGIGP